MAFDVVIGLGNPVLSDDGVGLAVVRHLRQQLGDLRTVSLAEVHCGGMELMEAMIGYERAFVVDAMTAGATAGTIRELTVDRMDSTRNAYSSHNGSVATALDFGRLAGAQLPKQIFVWGVEALDVATFGERLTPPVSAAVPIVASAILQRLLPGLRGTA